MLFNNNKVQKKELKKEIINTYKNNKLISEETRFINDYNYIRKFNEYGDIIYEKGYKEEIIYEYDERRRLILKKTINLSNNEIKSIKKNIYNINNDETYIEYIKDKYQTSYKKIRLSDGQYVHCRETRTNSGTSWLKRKFDEHGNIVYFKNKEGELIRRKFDEYGSLIYSLEILNNSSFYKPKKKRTENIRRYDNNHNLIYDKYLVNSKTESETYFKYNSNNLLIYKKVTGYFYDDNTIIIEETYNRYDDNNNMIYEAFYETKEELKEYDKIKEELNIKTNDLLFNYNNIESISNPEISFSRYNWNHPERFTLDVPVIRSDLYPDYSDINERLTQVREYISNALSIYDTEGREQLVINNGDMRQLWSEDIDNNIE